MKTRFLWLSPVTLALAFGWLPTTTDARSRTSVEVGVNYTSRNGAYSVGYHGGSRYYGHGYYGPRYHRGGSGWGIGFYGVPLGVSLSFGDRPYYGTYYPPPPVYYAPAPAPTVIYSQPPPPPPAEYVPPAPTPTPAPRVERTPPPQPLRLADVKALVRSGVSDEVIISQMRQARVVYRLNTAEIMDLKDNGVSNQVLDFMINTPSLYR